MTEIFVEKAIQHNDKHITNIITSWSVAMYRFTCTCIRWAFEQLNMDEIQNLG